LNEKIKCMDCVIAYVESAGDYKKIARQLFVHENTVRYRINSLRERLGYKDNIIKFHETLALFVSMHKVIEK